MSEHPVDQDIDYIVVSHGVESVEGVASMPVTEGHRVGFDGVTRIEACTKSGLHADMPYVRVWRGNHAVAEFCQHNIIGVYFKQSETEAARIEREIAELEGGFGEGSFRDGQRRDRIDQLKTKLADLKVTA